MYSTLLLESSDSLAKITLNRPEKRNAISTQMMSELQTALDEIEKTTRARGDHHRGWQSILRGYGFGDACEHCETISRGEPGRFAPNRQNASPHLEFSEAADRGGERRGVRRRLWHRDAVRFNDRGAGS